MSKEQNSNNADNQQLNIAGVICRFFKELYLETKEGLEEDEKYIAFAIVAAIPYLFLMIAIILSSC